MAEFETSWSKEELHAYLMIYCANADFVESAEEVEKIKASISDDAYSRMHGEFEGDNDYQSIQKIRAALERFDYSWAEKDHLLADMKDMFMADGKFEEGERILMRGLQHIFE